MRRRNLNDKHRALIVFVLFVFLPIVIGLVCYGSVEAQRPPHTTCMEDLDLCLLVASPQFDGQEHFATASMDYNMIDGCFRMEAFSWLDPSDSEPNVVTVEWFQGYDKYPGETYTGRAAIVDYDVSGQEYLLVQFSSCVEDHGVWADVLINGQSPLDAGAMFESTQWETFEMDGSGVNELAIRVSGPGADRAIGVSATFMSWLGHENATRTPILFDITNTIHVPAVKNGNNLP